MVKGFGRKSGNGGRLCVVVEGLSCLCWLEKDGGGNGGGNAEKIVIKDCVLGVSTAGGAVGRNGFGGARTSMVNVG